jgi:hypothetical protein
MAARVGLTARSRLEPERRPKKKVRSAKRDKQTHSKGREGSHPGAGAPVVSLPNGTDKAETK